MPSYLYRAARADGTTLEGQAEGEDEQAVRAELEKQGFLVFRLRPLGAWPALLGSGLWGRKRGMPLQEFLVFNQELLALVKAGLPTFSSMYGEAGTNVPEATRALITIVEGIQSHLVWIGLAIVALVVAFKWWVRTETGRALWDRTTLTLPLIGDVLVKHQTIQFARTLATVLAGGTPLVSALQTVRGALTNRFLAAGLATATERVREGTTLSAALEGVKVFARMALEMLAVGEGTGSLHGRG